MNYSDIYDFIESNVITALGSIPVELPNTIVDFSGQTTWVRITHLPNRATPGTLGANGLTNRSGITQVDVFVRTGSGPTTVPDDIVAAFTRSTSLSTSTGYIFNVLASRAESGASNNITWWQERVLITWNSSTSV